MNKLLIIASAIILVLGGSLLLLSRGTTTQQHSQPIQTQQLSTTPTAGAKSASQTVTPFSQTPTQTQNQANTVTLTANGFSPQTLTIQAGATVSWVNKSGDDATVNSNPHPTHTNYPPLNLGNFSDGGTLSLTFPTPGTYGYHNHLNPSETGTVVVQ